MQRLMTFAVPALFAAGLAAASGPGSPPQGMMEGSRMGGMMGMMQHMQSMDANRDGVASKDEFMRAHEAMFDAMKNPQGVIDMASMQGMCPMMSGTGHHQQQPAR